ncbi:MAG: YebG family protein [Desulfosarcina sp.]|nr:YebG family protein [Desulfobacterales bacterium]
MAVITRYVVVREGVELDQVFSVKKEAEAYDKMLDAADSLAEFIRNGNLAIDIDTGTIETLAVFLAKNGPEVVKILKGVKPLAAKPESKKTARARPAESPRETAPAPTRGRKPKRKG